MPISPEARSLRITRVQAAVMLMLGLPPVVWFGVLSEHFHLKFGLIPWPVRPGKNQLRLHALDYCMEVASHKGGVQSHHDLMCLECFSGHQRITDAFSD